MIIFSPKLMNVEQLVHLIGDCAVELANKSPDKLASSRFELERSYRRFDIIEAIEYIEDALATVKVKTENHRARVSA